LALGVAEIDLIAGSSGRRIGGRARETSVLGERDLLPEFGLRRLHLFC
jgi:hypothetical protein